MSDASTASMSSESSSSPIAIKQEPIATTSTTDGAIDTGITNNATIPNTTKKKLGRPKGSRSKREVYLEERVASLKQKCLESKKKIEAFEKKSLEKDGALADKDRALGVRDDQIRIVTMQRDVLFQRLERLGGIRRE